MAFSINEIRPDPALKPYIDQVIAELQRKQHQLLSKDKELNFVMNLVNIKNPGAYSRKRPEEFVISFAMLKPSTKDIRATCYQGLVKTLSNLFFGFLPGDELSPL